MTQENNYGKPQFFNCSEYVMEREKILKHHNCFAS